MLRKVSTVKKVSIGDAKIDFSQIKDTKEREIHIRGYNADDIGPKFGARHVQILLIFLCLTVGFTMRTNLSVAIVAMTDNTTSSNPDVPTYDWNNTSVILSSFFWGYVCLQVLAGYLGKTYGPKYFLLLSFFISCIAFSLIPIAADKMGSIGVMLCRIVQGLGQGFMFPSTHNVLGKWAPTEERSTLGIIAYSGISCGTILSSILTGYVSSSSLGWPATFYIFGGLGFCWCILYLIFGQNGPSTHPRITPEERRYIEESLGQTEDDQNLPVPWLTILSCIKFWAIITANIGGAWGFAMLMTQTPTYLAKVMKFDMKSNGLVSALPYMVGTLTGFIFAPLADWLVARKYLKLVTARKFFQIFGSYSMVVVLVLLAYESTTKTSAVVLLCLGNAAYSSTLVGYSVNHVDLSPRFSGIMQGFSNGISQFIAIFSPLMVQFVVKDKEDVSQWRIVFGVAAIFYFVCATFYGIFASATRQPWDGPQTKAIENMERIKKKSVISITGF